MPSQFKCNQQWGLKVYKEPLREVDLNYDVYPYVDYIVRQREKPKMTELRLIVEDIIVDLRMRQPELVSGVTSTHVLLALASQGVLYSKMFVHLPYVASRDQRLITVGRPQDISLTT